MTVQTHSWPTRVSGGVTTLEMRPRLRGVIHAWAFVACLPVAAYLLHSVPAAARVGSMIMIASLTLCFGTSALYHRGQWSPAARAVMRRIDHSVIFLTIAGTFAPLCLNGVPTSLGYPLLSIVFAGAVGGIILSQAWPGCPRLVEVGPYVGLGGTGVVAVPAVWVSAGPAAATLFVLGGLVYLLGGVAYAVHRPFPRARVFGYHEIFHVATVVGAAAHVAVVCVWIAPLAH